MLIPFPSYIRYPWATKEELEFSDKICIICREELDEAKKLSCGHMFHFGCLRSWLERQQACPTCRTSLLDPIRVPATATAAVPVPVAPAVPEHPNVNEDYHYEGYPGQYRRHRPQASSSTTEVPRSSGVNMSFYKTCANPIVPSVDSLVDSEGRIDLAFFDEQRPNYSTVSAIVPSSDSLIILDEDIRSTIEQKLASLRRLNEEIGSFIFRLENIEEDFKTK